MPKNQLLRKRRSKDDSQEFSAVANYLFRSLFIYQLFIRLFRLIVIKCGLDFQLTSRGRMINYKTNAIG